MMPSRNNIIFPFLNVLWLIISYLYVCFWFDRLMNRFVEVRNIVLCVDCYMVSDKTVLFFITAKLIKKNCNPNKKDFPLL